MSGRGGQGRDVFDIRGWYLIFPTPSKGTLDLKEQICLVALETTRREIDVFLRAVYTMRDMNMRGIPVDD